MTNFDAALDARESYEHPAGSYGDGMSQDMGDSEEDSMSSSNYTGSGDYQDDVSDNVSERDGDGIEDLQTV